MGSFFDGLAAFGRMESILGLIIGIPIGIALIVAGFAASVSTPSNDPSHPNSSSGFAGARIGLIGAGVLVLLVSFAHYWLAKKSPVFAAVEGGADLARLVGKAVKSIF